MPRITLRRLVIAVLTAGAAGAAVLASAVIAGLLTTLTAILVALSTTILAALAILALGIRRLDTKVKGILHESTTQQVVAARKLDEATHSLRTTANDIVTMLQDARGSRGEDRVELLMRLDRTDQHITDAKTDLAQVAESVAQVTEAIAEVDSDVGDLPHRLVDPAKQAAAAVVARLPDEFYREMYTKVEAYADLRALIAPRAPLPPLGGWALDADVMHAIAQVLSQHRPELIVECGSGSSSVWLGYLVERTAAGRVVSLEHDEHYLRMSRDLVRSHHLDETVEIRHAPLTSWQDEGDDYEWYAPAAVEDLKGIGLLLVDGPPAAVGRQARYPAGPLLMPRCTDDVIVVVDDTNRADEKAVIERWRARWPELGATVRRRGAAHVLFREPTA